MLVEAIFPPGFTSNARFVGDATSVGYYVSGINVESYSVFRPQHFQETLRDWGFYGPATARPSWL